LTRGGKRRGEGELIRGMGMGVELSHLLNPILTTIQDHIQNNPTEIALWRN